MASVAEIIRHRLSSADSYRTGETNIVLVTTSSP